jgi:hypothetical protein
VKYCPVDVIPSQKIFRGRLFILSGFYFHFRGNPRIRGQFPSLIIIIIIIIIIMLPDKRYRHRPTPC